MIGGNRKETQKMSIKGWKFLASVLIAAVVILVVAAVYLATVANMGLISTMADNQAVTVGPLSSSAVHFGIRFSGYLTITYNSTAAIAITVYYTFAQQNFTSTHLGTSGRIALPVLPSTVTITFTSALQKATIRYTVSEQY